MESPYGLLAQNLDGPNERIAVVDGDASWTHAQLDDEVRRVAAWLKAAGVGVGDRVCVHLPKGVEEIAAMLGASRVGAVFVNVNRQWTPPQLRFVLEDSGARALVAEGPCVDRLVGCGADLSQLCIATTGRASTRTEATPWSELPAEDTPVHDARGDELAALIYTSGSTGKPKGVMLTNTNLVLGARSIAEYLNNVPEDRVLSLLPFSFDYGLSQLTSMLHVGGTVVLLRAMMPVEIVRTIRERSVTGLPALPSVWVPLVRQLLAEPTELPTLRYLTNTGGAIPTPTLRAFPEVFPGADVYLMYGQTEAFRSTYLQPSRFASKMGSIGQAIPNAEVFVVAPGRGVCAPGEEGELLHRGPLISRGYWNRPGATESAIRPCPELADRIGDEPVLHTGDVVRADEDGDLWFVGRRDGLIKSSGHRISPTEVEDVVAESGLVTAVIAFGTPDEEAGEVVAIAVCTAGRDVDQTALLRHCRGKLPGFMTPQRVHVWSGEFPRTPNGKLDRVLVRERCLER